MCPPGVDQTTRTSERWTLLAPALEDKYDITPDLEDEHTYRPDISKFLRTDFTWGAFDKLAQFQRNGEKALSLLSRLSRPYTSHHSSPLECLPVELIRIIISNQVLEPVDVVSLGLTCHLLWSQALQHIASTCSKGPWADTPLVCTGTWTMSLPPAIHNLHPHMKQDEELFFNRARNGSRWGPMRGVCPAREYNWSAITDYDDKDEPYNGTAWSQALMGVSDAARIPDKSLRLLKRSLDAILNPPRSTMPTAWRLRNLTTKEYVCLKASPMYGEAQRHVHVKGMPKLSLDKAILLRICWSAPHGMEQDDDEDDETEGMNELQRMLAKLKRGKWAGHRFDVSPTVRGRGSEEIDGWRDVTHEIIQDAAAWYKSFL